jgi:hypothetical protein
MARIHLQRHRFHGNWNYTIVPDNLKDIWVSYLLTMP